MMKSRDLIRKRARATEPRRRGSVIVELALLSPWIFLLFMAVFDFGFYAYAAISTANAARVAAMATSATWAGADSQSLACSHALEEMRSLPNIRNMPADYGCGASPLTVTAEQIQISATVFASRVRVTYQSVQLFPLPFLTGRMTMVRTVQMRVLES